MGVAAAAGSFGQFLMVPVENWLIGSFGWQIALFVLGCLALAIMPLAFGLREPDALQPPRGAQQSIGAALREAFGYPSFQLLMAGYFVCGFQVVFIGVHMPSYLKDNGLTPDVATTALALIGLFNVVGTYAAGSLGQRLPKQYILSAIYALRSVAIVAFLAVPLTPWSVYIFASVMGVLWLSTVPPTNAVVAQIFGVQYLSMLGGFVFLSHQIGSFLGAWLGGKLYDATGSYDVVWWIAVALGVFAALINLPVREHAIARPHACRPRMKRRRALTLALAAWRGGCWRLVFAAYLQPGPDGDAGQPALDLLLRRARRMPDGALALGAALVAAGPPPARSVLDVACGSGRHVRWFAQRGCRVTGVDRDAAATGAAAAASAELSWPTSKAARGRCRAGASMRWSSPTTCGAPCCRRSWPASPTAAC